MSIHILADDYLATIFKFLPYVDRLNMENVCKKWKHISESKAWNEVENFLAGDFNFYNTEQFGEKRPPQETVEKVIIRCGQYLKKIALNGSIQPNIMRVVADYCYNITYIELGLNNYNSQDFVGVFEKLTKLRTIKVLTHHHTKFDPQNFKSLTADINTIYYSIGLYENSPSRAWYNDFSSVIRKFHSLQSLNLREIKFDSSVFKIITKIRTLKHLGLIYCKLPSNWRKIQKLVNLRSLELERIINMESTCIDFISENMQNLEIISIRSLLSPKVTRQGFYKLSAAGSLKSIRFCLLHEQIDNTVLFQFQNLIKFECCGCYRVTDVALIRILQNCPNLELLNVMGTAATVATVKIADDRTRVRFGNASVLFLFIHRNVIKDFEDLNRPTNNYLELDHEVFWESQTRIFT